MLVCDLVTIAHEQLQSQITIASELQINSKQVPRGAVMWSGTSSKICVLTLSLPMTTLHVIGKVAW